MTRYEQKVQDLENSGLITSDAQAVIDAEVASLIKYLTKELGINKDQVSILVWDYYDVELD